MLTASPLLGVYGGFPVQPVRGRGSWLEDASGARWLDAYGGHAVSSTGHSHPHVVDAIARQAGALLFYSSMVEHPARETLARMLVERAPAGLDRVFLVNSGAEANENALFLARKRTGRKRMVSVEGGWHGRTAVCQAVTDGAKYEAMARGAGLEPSVKVPFGDLVALERAMRDDVAAVILEPVQGMGGARVLGEAYLRGARDITQAHGAALIFDEVQCGVGRVGMFTGAELFGVTPDALTLAKGLGSGLPIGAVLVSPFLHEQLKPGDLGTTFGGGPVPCAAAVATLEVLDREGLLANATRVGEQLRAGAHRLGISTVHGCGLLLGFVLDRPASEVQRALFAHRILVGTATDPHILRLLPPLCFTTDEADLVLGALAMVLA